MEAQISRLFVNFGILLLLRCSYITNHMIYCHLFGKQESLESRQEYWNQAKILLKIPKDSQTKSIVSDPSHQQQKH